MQIALKIQFWCSLTERVPKTNVSAMEAKSFICPFYQLSDANTYFTLQSLQISNHQRLLASHQMTHVPIKLYLVHPRCFITVLIDCKSVAGEYGRPFGK